MDLEHVPKKCGLYVRVSSTDGRQTFENQLPDLERLAARLGVDIVVIYAEKKSAGKKRSVFKAMLEDAQRGVFSVLLIWALDRFGRSMAGNMEDALVLSKAGVALVSHREAWLDTTRGEDDPTRPLLFAIFSWAAEQEKRRLSERTKVGLQRAVREGKRLGRRHRLSRADAERVRTLHDAGESQRAIAQAVHAPRRTVRRILAGQNGYTVAAPKMPDGGATSPGGES